VAVEPLPLELVIEIVNEWGEAPRRAAGEQDQPYPGAAGVGVDGRDLIAKATTAHIVDTANQLHEVFAAVSATDVARRLDELVSGCGLAPYFVADGDSVLEAWTAPTSSIAAAATLALVLWFRANPDARRLGVCAGDACVDVYVDVSPAGRRRYCSITCQNRVRARTYRAAHRR
jgi:predicted RNA-binding Zn ribbon-like protein